MPERVGRAVLELTTEGGSFFKGIEQARAGVRSLGATIRQINADSARISRSFSGQPVISEAVKLTNVLTRLGGVERLTANERVRANRTLEEAVLKWKAIGRPQTEMSARMQEYAIATRAAIPPTSLFASNVGLMAAAGVLAGQAVSSLIEQMAKFGAQSVFVAARTQTLTLAAEYLGQQTGKSRDEVDALLKTLNKQGISMQESANLVTQLSRANLGLEHATELAAIAQNTASIAGLSSSETLNQIIQAIITLQPRMLHTVGIMATLQGAEQRVAEQTGRTVNSFTAEERQMILLNDVLRAGAQIQGTYAVTMQTVGKQLTSLPRFVQDAQTAIGETFLPTLSEGVTIATKLLQVMREYPKTFVAVSTALLAAGAAGGLFIGGIVGVSAAAVAGGAAVLGLIGLFSKYVSELNDGTSAMKKFIAAGKIQEDQLTSTQKEMLKLAGTLHDNETAQRLAAEATGRTADQLSEQEKQSIKAAVAFNNGADIYKDFYNWLRDKVPLPDLIPEPPPPRLPAAPAPPGVPEGFGTRDIGGLIREARDIGAAQAALAKSNAQYRDELKNTGATLDFYIKHSKDLGAVDLDTDEKIANRLEIDISTVHRRREEIEKLNKEAAQAPFAVFKRNLDKLVAQLRTSTDKLTPSEFVREFGNKLDDAERDMKRFGITGTKVPAEIRAAFARLSTARSLAAFEDDLDKLTTDLQTATDKMSDAEFAKEFRTKLEDTARDLKRFGYTGTQIPAEVTAALLRLNQIDLAEWAQKEAADLATLTDSLKGLGAQAIATDEAITKSVGEGIEAQAQIARESEGVLAAIGNRRIEHDIEMAKQRGANWRQVYALERQLAERRLVQAIAETNTEFKDRGDAIDQSTQAGIDAYHKLQDEHALVIRQMVEDFNLGEQEKLDELRHTHDIWVRTWDNMRLAGEETIQAISDGFASMIVGARNFKDAFLDIWHSIQSSLARIFSDILNDFIHRFLAGLVRGIAGAKLGQTLVNAIAGGVGGAALGGGAAAIGGAAAAGGGAVAAGFVGSEVAGTAAAATAATGGAAAGGGFLGGLGAAATNPYVLGAAAAVIGGIALYRHFRTGARANDQRDKFLAQFSAFDPANVATLDAEGHQNPRGFYGLDRLLTKYKHHDLFEALIRAKNPDQVRAAEDPIAAFLKTLGRTVKVFRIGTSNLDFQNFGAQTSAELHGEEAVIPKGGGHRLAAEIAAALRQFRGLSVPPLQMPMLMPALAASMSAPTGGLSTGRSELHVHQHNLIRYEASMIDAENGDRHFERHTLPRLKQEFTFNNNRLATIVKRALKD
jgi:hypothetical protein